MKEEACKIKRGVPKKKRAKKKRHAKKNAKKGF